MPDLVFAGAQVAIIASVAGIAINPGARSGNLEIRRRRRRASDTTDMKRIRARASAMGRIKHYWHIISAGGNVIKMDGVVTVATGRVIVGCIGDKALAGAAYCDTQPDIAPDGVHAAEVNADIHALINGESMPDIRISEERRAIAVCGSTGIIT